MLASHTVKFKNSNLPAPVYTVAVVYICRLAKLNKPISPKVIHSCLQLACKFCDVAVEGTGDFELQFFIMETVNLFVSEKTYLVYT